MWGYFTSDCALRKVRGLPRRPADMLREFARCKCRVGTPDCGISLIVPHGRPVHNARMVESMKHEDPRMRGILRIAYKLLVNDRAKYRGAAGRHHLRGVPDDRDDLAVRRNPQRSSATVINIGASIWVMDPAMQTVANTIPLPDYVLDEVRSIPGVKYAVPLYSGAALLKLRDGTYQAANVVGPRRHQPVRPARAAGAARSRTSTPRTPSSPSRTRSSTSSRIRRSARSSSSTTIAA